MLTSYQLYLILKLDTIQRVSLFMSLTVIFIGSFIITLLDSKGIDYVIIKKGITIFLILLTVFGSIYTFCPTTKEMITVIVLPKIVNSEKKMKLVTEWFRFCRFDYLEKDGE